MKTTITYKGTLNGVHGLWCGFKPEGVVVDEEITVYHADEGKVFKKGDELLDCVVLKDGEKIEDYQEIVKPEEPENEGE